MCGIVALFAREGPVPENLLGIASERLRHRGPNDLQTWLSPSGRAGLGHTRLSIIDIAGGQQPIANEDASKWIVVNGEFYDFERIQRNLELRGHRMRTKSDSEIALHLYEDAGIGALQHLRGEFAFALWDEKTGSLFAARDRFGIKPLYYVEAGGMLWLASEIKALAAAGVKLSWDTESVRRSIFSDLALEQTLFAGVKQIAPGCWLRIDQNGLERGSYWEPDYPLAAQLPVLNDEECISRVRAGVEDAVRVRMRADVPIGCMLSGGLDSSAALGIAVKYTSRPLKVFTVAFDHPRYDESAIAERTAKELGAEFHALRLTNRDFAAALPDAVWASEGIHYNTHGAARFLMSRAIREAGISVVLAGEGADELAASYRFCDPALGIGGTIPPINWDHDLLKAISNARIGSSTAVATRLRQHAQLLGFPNLTISHVTGQRARSLGVFDPSFLDPPAGSDPYFDFFSQFAVEAQLAGREPIKQVLYLWLKTGLAGYILGMGERLDMAFAIEQRLPFLDHALFEQMRSIPGSMLRRNGVTKWPLREALRPFVPAAVYTGEKKPFHAPPTTLQAGNPMLILAQNILRSKEAGDVPFFNKKAIGRLLDKIESLADDERAPFDSVVLLLLSLAILHERYRL